MKSFCFFTNKGGVGKTTLALHSAHSLALAGFKTLLVDLDGQSNLTKHVTGDTHSQNIGTLLVKNIFPQKYILPTSYSNLSIIPGNKDLDNLPILYPKIMRTPTLLKNTLQSIVHHFDYIILDCPSAMNWITKMATYMASKVIIPIQPEPYALQGLKDMSQHLNHNTATAQIHKIVINMYRGHTQLHQNIAQDIRHLYGDKVAQQVVRQSISLAEASSQRKSIFEFAPTSIGALDLFALSWEVFGVENRKSFDEGDVLL
jgi:chromosome partitioning protein